MKQLNIGPYIHPRQGFTYNKISRVFTFLIMLLYGFSDVFSKISKKRRFAFCRLYYEFKIQNIIETGIRAFQKGELLTLGRFCRVDGFGLLVGAGRC